jgi:hypothetical protein
MAKTIYVVPAPGEQVPIPGGGYLPAGGKRVDDSPYWRRRVADGVCSIGVPPSAPRPTPPVTPVDDDQEG